ncbi:MAG: XRE family transcriptional regulator [bacterium]
MDSYAFSNGLKVSDLGSRIRSVRRARGMSLDDLALRSSVSRSMLSEVERGSKIPSVLVLDRIASGLGSSIGRLLEEPDTRQVVVLRRDSQQIGRDSNGWEWHLLSPPLAHGELQFFRCTAPPRTLGPEFTPHAPGSQEWVAVQSGKLTLTIDGEAYELADGDAICYAGDRPHSFANHSDGQCSYYLLMDIRPWAASDAHKLSARSEPRTPD